MKTPISPIETFRVFRDVVHARFNKHVQARHCLPPSALTTYLIRWSVKKLKSASKKATASNELAVLCTLKNAEHLVEAFIRYYLKLGATQIVLLDNGSKDKTIEIASRFPEVSILSCQLPFASYVLNFRNYLLRYCSHSGWNLVADVDEHFDYPGRDRFPLPQFLDHLNQQGVNAVMAHKLDLFSKQTIQKGGKPFSIAEMKYFDWCQMQSTEKRAISKSKKSFYACLGGVHNTIFKLRRIDLSKFPLLKIGGSLKPEHCGIHQISNACIADFICILKHYQFTSSFGEKVDTAVANSQYFNHSQEYLFYKKYLDERHEVNIYKEAKQPTLYKNSEALVESGYLPKPDYLKQEMDH